MLDFWLFFLVAIFFLKKSIVHVSLAQFLDEIEVILIKFDVIVAKAREHFVSLSLYVCV